MKCFYHSSDLDGHCSGAIVKFFNPECELFPINYGQDFPWDKISPGEKVFMVDFALQPFEDMLKLNALADLVWIDHHQTAILDRDKYGEEFVGVQISGLGACALVWEEMTAKEIPLAVKLLSEYDVWNHTDERTLPFQYGMRMLNTDPNNSYLWPILFAGDKKPDCYETVNQIIQDGSLIIRYEDQTNTKFCETYAFETKMPVYPCDNTTSLRAICVNKGLTNSKVFDSVWDPKKYDIMITFSRLPLLPKHKWTVSLYSDKDEVDCGIIAKSFGGGGHKGAAGFQCEELPFDF